MDDIRTALTQHGKRRAAARAKAREEAAALRDLAPKALAAGLTKTEIARLAQISRPALDDMLRPR